MPINSRRATVSRYYSYHLLWAHHLCCGYSGTRHALYAQYSFEQDHSLSLAVTVVTLWLKLHPKSIASQYFRFHSKEVSVCKPERIAYSLSISSACWGGKRLGYRRNQFIFPWILAKTVGILTIKVVEAEIRQLIPILWSGNPALRKEPARYTHNWRSCNIRLYSWRHTLSTA